MGLSSNYYIYYLLATLFCGHGLAARYQNASITGHNHSPAGITSSGSITAALSSTSTHEDPDNGCVAVLPAVITYYWAPSPNAKKREVSETATASMNTRTKSTGTLTSTVDIINSYKRDGTWVAVTVVSTVTFPTGLTYMDPGYEYYTKSGSSSGPTYSVTLSSAVIFPSPLSASAWATDEGHGITWTLASMGHSPFSSQIRLLRSMYPSESALQICSPTNPLIAVQVPPAAAQLMTLVHAKAPTPASLQSTWATVDGASTLPTAVPGQTTVTTIAAPSMATGAQGLSSNFGSHPSETAKDRPVKTTRVHVATTHAPQHSSEEAVGELTNTGPSGSETVVDPSDETLLSFSTNLIATESHTTSDQAAHTSKPIQITIGTSIITADSATGFKIGSKVLSPAGSAVTISSTAYSLASAGTALVVNGRTSAIRQTVQADSKVVHAGSDSILSTGPLQANHGLSTEMLSGSKLLVNGHTLAMNSTITLGSGSVITRVALATDTAGRTVLLGDSITRAPGTSCVGRCSVIKQSMRSTATNMQLMTSASAASSSSSDTSRASSTVRPFKAVCINAMTLFWSFMLCFTVWDA